MQGTWAGLKSGLKKIIDYRIILAAPQRNLDAVLSMYPDNCLVSSLKKSENK